MGQEREIERERDSLRELYVSVCVCVGFLWERGREIGELWAWRSEIFMTTDANALVQEWSIQGVSFSYEFFGECSVREFFFLLLIG